MKPNINFHQTFAPTPDYLVRIIKICPMINEMTKEEISAVTGIPTGKSSGKVVPHIEYAIYMGLVENNNQTKGKYKLSLSPLGNVVAREDVNLKDELTLWLIHANMCSPITGAPQWHILFTNIMPRYRNGISLPVLTDEFSKNLEGFSQKSKLGPIFSFYQNTFTDLDLIEKQDNTIFIKAKKPDNDYMYLYAYIMTKYWENAYPNILELSENQFVELNVFSVFGFDLDSWDNVVHKLVDYGVIKINGQLSPYTIIKNMTSEQIALKLYSLLL